MAKRANVSRLIPRPLPAITSLAYTTMTTLAEMYGIHGAFGKLCNLLQYNTTVSTTRFINNQNNAITLASYPRTPVFLVEIHLNWELGIGHLSCRAARM